MTADTSVLAAVIAAAASIGAAVTALLGNLYMATAETRRRRTEAQIERRKERKEAYLAAIDLMTDWQWRLDDPKFDVVRDFSILFVRSATRVRLYGSPASIAAVDEIQEGLAKLNRARDETGRAGAQETIGTALDHLVIAARADVGPRDDDLPQLRFREGAGPRA